MIDVAHIIPPKALSAVPGTVLSSTHLLLPSLMGDLEYREYYRQRAAIDYLILDNGIAEGRAISFGHLMAMAKMMNVREVVLPDVLCDMDKTLELLAQTFYSAFQYRKQFRFMFVPQGKTVSDIIHCAEQAMNMCPMIINTFGIPRHILSYSPSARIQIAEELSKRYWPNKEIHLLGTHPDNLAELAYYANDYKEAHVRSVDTSLAWNATRQDVQLKDPKSLYYNLSIARQPIDEFAKGSFDHADPRYKDLLVENMEAINAWV